MKSVTVVTNGSKVTAEWMREFGYYLDILAVSCDSFQDEVNKKIGRHAKVELKNFSLLILLFTFLTFLLNLVTQNSKGLNG